MNKSKLQPWRRMGQLDWMGSPYGAIGLNIFHFWAVR